MAGFDWVSFTTDYGHSDGFVAICHGVLARLAPQVRVIDVTHDISPGDVVRGAAVLAQTVPHLPAAVHLAVVDPGVGTGRRGIAVRTAEGILVGPDNGLLNWAADALGGVESAAELTNPDWLARPSSQTFHGRDIFAPVAAQLAAGAPFAAVGPALDPGQLVRLPEPTFTTGDGWLAAEVLTVDRFGNVQLTAPASALAGLGDRLTVNGVPAASGTTFADVPIGDLVVLADSAGQVAVAVHRGRASVVLSIGPGDLVRITAG